MKNILQLALLLGIIGFTNCTEAPTNNTEATIEAAPAAEPSTPATFATTKYGGTYSFGGDTDKSSAGHLSVYPASDTSLLFYLEVNKGAPSYNMGMLFGSMNMNNGTATYFKKEDYQKQGCKLQFSFQDNGVTVSTAQGFEECEFGNGVVADNTYAKTSSDIPASYIGPEGDTVLFSTAKPEN